jgi:uncharacterized protein
MSVLMELSKIIISETQDQQIIVLREVDGDRRFPIVIGTDVAAAIDRRLKGIYPERPMTHDLLANTIALLGGTVERIDITDLKAHTYFARVAIRQGANLVDVDSRPSDAIALGIATNVPIYVAEHVLAAACE